MEHSLGVFLQDILIQLGPKKVSRALNFILINNYSSGWTPSTFKSSRNDRSGKKTTRAEDFMDEEDLAEMREDNRLVDRDEVGEIQRQPNEEDEYARHPVLLSAVSNIMQLIFDSSG
jgi:hypothetical protein